MINPLKLDSVRVMSVQFKQRKISSYVEFIDSVKYFLEVAQDYNSDFILFPEYFSMQLLSIGNAKLEALAAVDKMNEYIPQLKSDFSEFSKKYNVNIISGSHLSKIGGKISNISYVFTRDGKIHQQEKIHATPDEKAVWHVEGGNQVNVIETDKAKIGVLICYDSEFPELARKLTDEGMQILFVPFLTDNLHGHHRVKLCCQARAIENQIYVVTAGNVGHLPNVVNMNIQYSQSAIITPCDHMFARDGIAAIADANQEMVIFADLNVKTLMLARDFGSVKNFNDRRKDLYRIDWLK